jgi:iron(II)-dependent oxidoreductase
MAVHTTNAETAAELADWVRDARQQTLDLIADLTDEQMMGPRLEIVNPLVWEIGHAAWFQEKWVLRHAAGRPPLRTDGDALWDSIAIPHEVRWNLPLPSRSDTVGYVCAVRDQILNWLARHEPTREEAYFIRLSVFHEDMHTEAFTYTRQTLGYPAPKQCRRAVASVPAPSVNADVNVPGGTFLLGATPAEPFIFDNEKWAHPVVVQPFAIARQAVTQAEFAAFVEEGGYERPEWWSAAGWQWRQGVDAHQPVYWRGSRADGWQRRDFDRWVPLEPDRPVLHVSWYEADAYCHWARRRLASEVEWEVAAAGEWDTEGRGLAAHKRRFPWSDDPPTPRHANLDWRAGGCADVGALPAGDSAFGCRQMIGNVWEWTATDFLPYPGFVADPYKEYSEPCFGTRKVLRGGCWTTRGRLLRNTWRNFYTPDRRDVWAGFRTCALQS